MEKDYYKNIKNIDIYIKGGFSETNFNILRHFSKDVVYKNYIFNCLTKIDIFDIQWFATLNEQGYFSSQKAPGPIKSDKEGYINVPFWNVLDYLERVSLEVNKPENSEYINDLIEIIKDVTQKGLKNNFRTSWYLVKITSNLPNKYITNEIIEFIPLWLDSKFGTDLQGKEIADRLLPKFLGSNKLEDIQKAELIIKHLTELKKKSDEQIKIESKFYEEKYIPLLDAYWLSYALEKNADKIAQKCSSSVILDFQGKIEKLLEKEISRNTRNYQNITLLFSLEPHEKKYKLKIYEYEKQLSQEELHILFTGFQFGEKGNELKIVKKFSFYFNNINSLSDFLNDSQKQIINNYPEFDEKKERLQSFLTYLYLGLFNEGTYDSFHNEEDLFFNKTLGVFHSILGSIISIRIKIFPEETNGILRSFLLGKYLYLIKFALYMIGMHHDVLLDLFSDYIRQDTNNLFLKSDYFGDEIRNIFININPENIELIDLLEKKIDEEAEVRAVSDLDKEYIKIWKQRCYKALSHIDKFNEKYLVLKKQSGIDPDLGPLIQKGESWVGPGPSPLSKEDIFKMSNEELAYHLKEFKTEDPWNGPSEEGLADQLKQFAKSKPAKFIDNMAPFKDTAYCYVYNILSGLVDAWNNNEVFNWNVLFDFIYNYINREDFWNNKLDMMGAFRADHKWIVGVIGIIIQDGTKNDEHAFAQELNVKALDIIEIILNKLDVIDEKSSFDSITHALNSSFGKILTAIIYLSLKEARYFDKSPDRGGQRWNSRARNFYETAMEKKIKEAYTLLGQYLSNFHYLDEKWTEEKINLLKNYFGKNTLWNLFMEGYLFSGRVYNNLFELMSSHYEFAINNESDNENFNRKLIHHIAIGYLRGIHDKIGNPLYKLLIDKWNPMYIKELINFFWMQRDYLLKADSEDDGKSMVSKKQYVEKVLEFWESLYEHYEDKNTNEFTVDDKKLLGSSAKLSIFLNEIDIFNYAWMRLSAPYVGIEYNAPFFIEYLDKIKDIGDNKIAAARYLSDIYLEMLKSFVPDFDKIHIHSIVEYLFKISKNSNDQIIKDNANQICNIYGPSGIKDDKGREFLRDLYEEYNLNI